MAILQIINTLDTSDGGPPRHALELAIALNKVDDAASTLLSIHGKPSNAVSVEEINSPAQESDVLFGLSSFISPESKRKFDFPKINTVVLHGYYLAWTPFAAILARLFGKKVFIIPHGSLTAWQSLTHPRRKAIWNCTAGYVSRVLSSGFLVGSEQEMNDLRLKFSKIQVHMIGVGTFLPEGINVEHGTHSPIRLVSLSRISRKKQIEVAIESLNQLQSSGDDFELVVAGEMTGDYGVELRTLTNSLGLAAKVKFVGQVVGEQKETLLRESDIFLLPSLDENFGIAVAEAAARGVPVIASNAVAAVKLLSPPGAIAIEECTPDEMSKAIAVMISGNFSSKRKDAYIKAQKVFSWNRVANKMIAVIRES